MPPVPDGMVPQNEDGEVERFSSCYTRGAVERLAHGAFTARGYPALEPQLGGSPWPALLAFPNNAAHHTPCQGRARGWRSRTERQFGTTRGCSGRTARRGRPSRQRQHGDDQVAQA